MNTIKFVRPGLFLSLCLILLLSSCEKGNNEIKIALMLGNMDGSRWQKEKEYFIKETQKLGCEGTVVSADFNEYRQYSQAEKLIDEGYQTLVIGAVNSTTGAAIVRLAKKNGVTTIAYDGIIGNCPLDYLITFDNKKIGKLMAEYAVSKVPQGNYVIIGGDRANLNATQIRKGQEEVLSTYTRNNSIKISYSTFIDGWNPENAYNTMKNYLVLSSEELPVAVLTSSDEMAQAVIKAYEDEKVKLPIVTGQDASLLGCRNLMLDKQAMTVYKPGQKLAALAANLAFKTAKGENIDLVNSSTFNGYYNVPTVHVDISSVDKDNLNSTVIADGFQKMEEIMNLSE